MLIKAVRVVAAGEAEAQRRRKTSAGWEPTCVGGRGGRLYVSARARGRERERERERGRERARKPGSRPRAAMACCGAPPKQSADRDGDRNRDNARGPGKPRSTGGAAEPGPLVFKTQHGELRFEDDGAVVIREEQAPEPEPEPSSPGGTPRSHLPSPTHFSIQH